MCVGQLVDVTPLYTSSDISSLHFLLELRIANQFFFASFFVSITHHQLYEEPPRKILFRLEAAFELDVPPRELS